MYSNHCKVVEDYSQEIKEEMIIEFLKLGKLTLEEIAIASKVSLEVVKEIAEKVAVKA